MGRGGEGSGGRLGEVFSVTRGGGSQKVRGRGSDDAGSISRDAVLADVSDLSDVVGLCFDDDV